MSVTKRRKKHVHRRKTSRDVGWSFPAGAARPNPRAWGNITLIDTCRCGYKRRTDVNQWWVERGPWTRP